MLKNQKNRMGKINTMLAAAVICTVAMTGCSTVSAQGTTTQQNVNQSDTVLLNTVSNTQGSALREKMLERFADGELPTDENGEIDRSAIREKMLERFADGELPTDENGEIDRSAIREKMMERFADGELPTDENGEIDRSQMRGRGGRNFFTGQTNTFGQDREQQDA